MCTLSLTPVPRGLRLCFNRDELRSRPVARRPSTHRYGARRATHPTDPQSGGTWIARNDAGLTCAVLNHTPAGSFIGQGIDLAPPAPRSRGTLIPSLLHLSSATDALTHALTLHPPEFAAFRLILFDLRHFFELTSTGHAFHVTSHPLTAQLLFTSSGLGDHLVDPPRRALFDQLCTPTLTPARQDLFHRHRWPRRPHLSVFMSRPDACTVSITTLDITPGDFTMNYTATHPPETARHDLHFACR